MSVATWNLDPSQVAEKARVLLAGTAQPGMPGYIRAYPIGQWGSGQGGGVESDLKGEFHEYGCLSKAVSCLALNHDGSLLFAGGEDGVLAMYFVADDPKAASKRVRRRCLPVPSWGEVAGCECFYPRWILLGT